MAQDPHLVSRAKHLRNDGSPFEAKLWRYISRSQIGGYKFRRQHVIGNCMVDFCCPQKGLIVEIDGDTHSSAKDAVRDQMNDHRGYRTIRFTNEEVGKNVDGVIARLHAELSTIPDRWPHPSPSPEGEGK